MTSTDHLDRFAAPAEKIRLFRSLFRGRPDVYPLRFESVRTGKAGYQPACANEWVKGVCEKPRIKCSECRHQRWLPITDEVVRWHLQGAAPDGRAFVMGIYPMLLDDSCHLLAIDLDGDGWQEDALAFRPVCERLGIPWVLERSRSGNGGHLWFFFEQAVPAVDARNLGAHLLTEAMEQRPEVGLHSYDRFFPNQDTLPRGGFGNLIALPLQHGPRTSGNSLFVDEHLQPFTDQWAFLAGIQRISPRALESIIQQARKTDRLLAVKTPPVEEWDYAPWTAPPSCKASTNLPPDAIPKKLEVIHADQLYIARETLPPPLLNRLLRLAAFQNPEFYRAQAMRLPVFDKPRVIACAELHPAHLALPRGCLEDLQQLCATFAIELAIQDKRQMGAPLEVRFTGELHPEQATAVRALAAHDTGVLAATTAFGKTVIGAWMIAHRRVKTLILVHRRQLQEQWIERLTEFLDIQKEMLGRIGGGRKKPGGNIDVALIQSMVRKGRVDDRIAEYGHLIVDECHHLPAVGFELVTRKAKARFLLGLSATVQRKDGHHPIIFMQCGPVRHRVDAKLQARQRPFTHRVIVRPTGFEAEGDREEDSRLEFQRLCDALAMNRARNGLIARDAVAILHEQRWPIILTERTEHLDYLAVELHRLKVRTHLLRGGLPAAQLREVLDSVSRPDPEHPAVLLATGRFVGEGFDCPYLDTLLLAMPVSWRGTIAQYAGRLHRLCEGKREVRILDYADLDEPMLERMFDRRCSGYESIGYRIESPGSAIPGWPVEVPLPAEPAWRQTYGATVRRLVRDGIDAPLAELFVQSAPTAGAGQPRSGSEAFLHARLQSMPETAGLFELNAELPIPFEGHGRMEVDFLCRKAKLVIELDGPTHLADETAWRRDRRKDALLQQHGYFILRFLTVDLASDLGRILDDIRALLTHRQ